MLLCVTLLFYIDNVWEKKGFSKHVFRNWYQNEWWREEIWVGRKRQDMRIKCSQIRMKTWIEMCVCVQRIHTNTRLTMCLEFKPTNGYRTNFLSSKNPNNVVL